MKIIRFFSLICMFILMAVLSSIILTGCDLFNPPVQNGGSTSNNLSASSTLKETWITASDADPTGDHFGNMTSISSDGNTLLVSAAGKNNNKGKVYIYKWNSSIWVETGITASDGVEGDEFGYDSNISSDGNTIAVGAINKNNKGKVYIYKWDGSTWNETGITATDSSTDDNFGYCVSISSNGNALAVGAMGKNDAQGKAYIYKWNGSAWVETGITASDGSSINLFGSAVSLLGLDGNTLAVGAYAKNSYQGKVYIYKWNNVFSTWDETTITASDGGANDFFGIPITLSYDGKELVVGASGKNSFQGKAYIYNWSGSAWVETGITGSDSLNNDFFGIGLNLSQDGNTLAVSASGKNNSQGKVYLYKWNGSTWNEAGLTASDAVNNDTFAAVSLNLDASVIAIGAPGKNNGQGKVYIYR